MLVIDLCGRKSTHPSRRYHAVNLSLTINSQDRNFTVFTEFWRRMCLPFNLLIDLGPSIE